MDRITDALEEIIDGIQLDLDRLARAGRQGEPDAASEKKYFQAQRRAFVKALRAYQEGTRVLWTGRSATVKSGSRQGVAHRLWQDGGVWRCSCEAGERGDLCYHHALINGYERAELLAEAHDDGMESADLCGGSLPLLDIDDSAYAELLAGLRAA